MPVTDLGYDDEGMPDWLQRMLGGVAPGGGVMQFPRSMTGQNMGYPALTAPAGAGAAPAGAQPAAPYGLSLSNLPNRAIGAGLSLPSVSNLFPGNPSPSDHGDAPPAVMSPEEIYQRQAASAGAPMDPTQVSRAQSPRAAPIDPYGSTPAAGPLPYQGAPIDPYGITKPAGPLPAQPARTRSSPASAATAPPAAPLRWPGAPNLGYYRPTTGNARGATWMPGAWPGGQPAAPNPANLPAPNAQPVSGQGAPSAVSYPNLNDLMLGLRILGGRGGAAPAAGWPYQGTAYSP